MKKIVASIFLAVFILIFSCLYAITNPVYVSKSNQAEHVGVDRSRLINDVTILTGTTLPRNSQNVSTLDTVADYIKSEWEKLELKVVEQAYAVNGNEYKNLICSFGPLDAERVIVGAHYDVCGYQPGADDNASGVAGLLEIARLLKKHAPILDYRIDLVAYTLEEPPYFRTQYMGSAVHAKYLFDNNIKVKMMICLEMIGYFSDEPKSQDYPIGILKLFYPTVGNFITVVGKIGQGSCVRTVKKMMKEGSNIKVCSINAPASMPGIDFSDHLNYWKYDYKAIMITNTAFYRNHNYHDGNDSIETLNFDKMAEVVKGVYWTIINL
ncbi:MAG: M28 family peptidase [Bacteroidia bacterium]|nr:M28 family peptidase [Bacteroidia bacterium]